MTSSSGDPPPRFLHIDGHVRPEPLKAAVTAKIRQVAEWPPNDGLLDGLLLRLWKGHEREEDWSEDVRQALAAFKVRFNKDWKQMPATAREQEQAGMRVVEERLIHYIVERRHGRHVDSDAYFAETEALRRKAVTHIAELQQFITEEWRQNAQPRTGPKGKPIPLQVIAGGAAPTDHDVKTLNPHKGRPSAYGASPEFLHLRVEVWSEITGERNWAAVLAAILACEIRNHDGARYRKLEKLRDYLVANDDTSPSPIEALTRVMRDHDERFATLEATLSDAAKRAHTKKV